MLRRFLPSTTLFARRFFMSSPVPTKKQKTTMSPVIATHSGQFHADEALAVFMLKQLPKYADASVLRTRDLTILNSDAVDIVVDVSAKYDGVKYFDHHQREFVDTLGLEGTHDTIRLSSAGLVYKHFGKDVIKHILLSQGAEEISEAEITADLLDTLYVKTYANFVEAIDANDNGISVYDKTELETISPPKYKDFAITLPAVVSRLNPRPAQVAAKGDEFVDAQFAKASELMGLAFVDQVLQLALSWYPAKQHVIKAFAPETRKALDPKGRILFFADQVNWKAHLEEVEQQAAQDPAAEGLEPVLYVVYLAGPNDWRVQAVEKATFVSRKALPEPWRGVRDEALSELSGVSGCTFVHASGFIGGNKTKEGALELAKKAADWE